MFCLDGFGGFGCGCGSQWLWLMGFPLSLSLTHIGGCGFWAFDLTIWVDLLTFDSCWILRVGRLDENFAFGVSKVDMNALRIHYSHK